MGGVVLTRVPAPPYANPLTRPVVEVADRVTGRYRLRTGDGETECSPTDAESDIELDLEDLGAAYMGRSRFRRLAASGRLRGRGEALAAADKAFTWDPQPWCPEIF